MSVPVKFEILDSFYSCMESCYWHLIEKRFCFDENIALYEEPTILKSEEKNNNMFDNMAFYDSVSVIAGRSIVTIDPLPENQPIVQQPQKRLRWQEKLKNANDKDLSKSVPVIFEDIAGDQSTTDSTDGNESDSQEKVMLKEGFKMMDEKIPIKKSVSFHNIPEKSPENGGKSENTHLSEHGVEIRKKSLRERRMSKSLYLKINLPKEIPIIRQHSMPKFYLDTPDPTQTESSLFRKSASALMSPLTASGGFDFDLYSIVQIEKSKSQNVVNPVPIHRESSRLSQIKERIKLKKSKSTISNSNLPHSNYI